MGSPIVSSRYDHFFSSLLSRNSINSFRWLLAPTELVPWSLQIEDGLAMKRLRQASVVKSEIGAFINRNDHTNQGFIQWGEASPPNTPASPPPPPKKKKVEGKEREKGEEKRKERGRRYMTVLYRITLRGFCSFQWDTIYFSLSSFRVSGPQKQG